MSLPATLAVFGMMLMRRWLGAQRALARRCAAWRHRRQVRQRLAHDRAVLAHMADEELRDLGIGRDAVPYWTSPQQPPTPPHTPTEPVAVPSVAERPGRPGSGSAHKAAVAPHHRQLDEA